ncbi:MAG: Uma2 family endonuclease [Isosphaeraceae bacterium]
MMATVTEAAPVERQVETIPQLENGDHLTRDEFERRYDAMPDLKKAELIEGVVHMPSPVGYRKHGHPHRHLGLWLASYELATPGVEGGNNTSIRLDLDNMPQPDEFLFIVPECGGQAKISEDDYIERAPELVAEVSSSTASYDLHEKRTVYRRNGAREYIVWRVLDRQLDWFILSKGRYEPLPLAADGIYRSVVFPGLWLDPAALLAGDLAKVLAVLQQGLQSPEHTEFVNRLAQARARSANSGSSQSKAT